MSTFAQFRVAADRAPGVGDDTRVEADVLEYDAQKVEGATEVRRDTKRPLRSLPTDSHSQWPSPMLTTQWVSRPHARP